jgi:hypothetical protein
MLNRCRNANDSSYLHYGGRGISVCLEWQTSFETFLRDMGERPNALYSIERKDVNKGYSKENCVWATDTEQARNKTNTVMLTAFGKSQTLDSWATEKGLRYHTIWARLLRGDSPEQALRPLERISPLRKEDRHVME